MSFQSQISTQTLTVAPHSLLLDMMQYINTIEFIRSMMLPSISSHISLGSDNEIVLFHAYLNNHLKRISSACQSTAHQ